MNNQKPVRLSWGKFQMNVLICDDEWRVKVHDFQAHLNTLQDLLQNHRHSQALLPAALSAVESDSLLP